jgi:hypothetical protein
MADGACRIPTSKWGRLQIDVRAQTPPRNNICRRFAERSIQAKNSRQSWTCYPERTPTERRPYADIARNVRYLIELATEENTLLELEPMSRMVPTTITRMTASITAYSAIS